MALNILQTVQRVVKPQAVGCPSVQQVVAFREGMAGFSRAELSCCRLPLISTGRPATRRTACAVGLWARLAGTGSSIAAHVRGRRLLLLPITRSASARTSSRLVMVLEGC